MHRLLLSLALVSLASSMASADRRLFTFTYEYKTVPKGSTAIELWHTESRDTWDSDTPQSLQHIGMLGEQTWELNSPAYLIGTYLDRTKDIQYLITRLAADSQQSGNLLYGTVRADQIAVSGHSWGEMAVPGAGRRRRPSV